MGRRRNARNLNFGFITVDGSLPLYDALHRLISMVIGIVRLHVFKARFVRPSTAPIHQVPKRVSTMQKEEFHGESAEASNLGPPKSGGDPNV